MSVRMEQGDCLDVVARLAERLADFVFGPKVEVSCETPLRFDSGLRREMKRMKRPHEASK